MRGSILGFVLVLLGFAAAHPDALDDALAGVGLRREDLGWRPRGYWSRYPADIAHKLRHFDDALAEPLAVVNVARTLGSSARSLLAPEALARRGEKSDGALYKAVFALGIERRIGSFRSYSANLTAADVDLVEALLEAQQAADRPVRFVTFGQDSPYPDYRADLSKRADAVPAAARPILGRLVRNLVMAERWLRLAWRHVPLESRLDASRRIDLGAELTDALDYAPEVDDVARGWDEASLWYAGLQCAEALDQARHALAALPPAPPFAFDWPAPAGWVRIRGGGDDTVDARDAWLLVDLGGNDRILGPAGAADATRPIGLCLDLAGNDVYEADVPAQGSGMCGIGILLDAAGNDTYRADSCAQGFGQLGLGVLADLDGNDTYVLKYSGQGAAFLGVGTLLDARGNDRYEVWSDGQGFGGAGGVGVLADRSGNDVYEAIRDPAVTGRASYHSEGKIAVSNAQGCGMGRRGDGADGHSWAGGLGALLDVEGDDQYAAGNWSMGTGYWFGTGLLWDGAGNDRYRGCVWSQGSGAHFCIGALVDEAGDDTHAVDETSTSSLAFGHDFTVALLIDGAGNDTYEVKGNGLGYSINRSVAMLIDIGGNDVYRTRDGNRPGMAIFDERFRDRTGGSTYFADASSLGLFLDVGGTDTYAPERANDSSWLDEDGSANPPVRNWSVGVDRAEGTVNLDPRPERPPSRAGR